MPTLADEARALHAALFGCAPDAATIARYEAAHAQLFANEAESQAVRAIVERGLDAEAIEFALRRRGRGRELTRKLRILSYLAEARAAYFERFVNPEASRLRAWRHLAGALLRTPWKLAKGEYAIRRHGLL